MGDPGGLLSLGSHRVGHDWSDLAAAAAALLEHQQLFDHLVCVKHKGVCLQRTHSLVYKGN